MNREQQVNNRSLAQNAISRLCPLVGFCEASILHMIKAVPALHTGTAFNESYAYLPPLS